MKQVPLDLARAPTSNFENFYPGPNAKLIEMLQDALARLIPMANKANKANTAPISGELASTPLESIFVCGDRGSGKTHLLHACEQVAQGCGLDVVHWQVQGQGEGQGHIRADSKVIHCPSDFKSQWRLMIIDDVHLMNEADQACAFNWFVNASAPGDHLRRMILMSADQHVSALAIRDDLRTRMAQGLCLELKTLDEQACRAVLIEQAKLRGLALKGDVLDFMMTRFSRDLSNLVGWLDQLDAFSLRTQRAITIPLIKDMLNEL